MLFTRSELWLSGKTTRRVTRHLGILMMMGFAANLIVTKKKKNCALRNNTDFALYLPLVQKQKLTLQTFRLLQSHPSVIQVTVICIHLLHLSQSFGTISNIVHVDVLPQSLSLLLLFPPLFKTTNNAFFLATVLLLLGKC